MDPTNEQTLFKLEFDDLTNNHESDDIQAVEFDVLPPVDLTDDRKVEIYNSIVEIDEQRALLNARIEELNGDIDRLTNHADGIDYIVAVASGIIAGIIDSVWVGEFSIDRATDWGADKVNQFVLKIAQRKGYKGDNLSGAVSYLEKLFPIVADKSTNAFGGGLQHHLRDFSHHPTPIGLIFSLLTQFTHNTYGTDTAGFFKIVAINEADYVLIGKNLPEKLTFGIINWFFHMVSDMAGSSTSVTGSKLGTGLPGPLVSLLKEISALPFFRNLDKKGHKEFSVWISKLFNGTLLGRRDERGKIIEGIQFDLRTEIGIVHEIGKQAVPVIVNECIVRGFYFIRRLFIEIKDQKIRNVSDLKKINWKNTLPFRNRTIVRMLTISTGTFTAIDLADAAIRSALNPTSASPATFASNMLLRVNFVGVGRFVIAIGTDVGMGIKKAKYEKERMQLRGAEIELQNAKLFYKQANMWIEAENTEKALQETYIIMEQTAKAYAETWNDIVEGSQRRGSYADQIRTNDPEYAKELLDDLLF